MSKELLMYHWPRASESCHSESAAYLFLCLMLQWLVVRYAIANMEIIHAAIRIAKQEGVLVSLDLASFEVTISLHACSMYLLKRALHFVFKYYLKLK